MILYPEVMRIKSCLVYQYIGSVAVVCIEFCPAVEGSHTWKKYDEHFFIQTKIAHIINRGECLRSTDYLPSYIKIDFVVFQ